METTTQAAFARLHGVSRKTATAWKRAGFLRLSGSQVDVAASNAALEAAGRSRLSPATLRRRVTRNTRNAGGGVSAGNTAPPPGHIAWTPEVSGQHAAAHPTAATVSAVVGGAALAVAEALLLHGMPLAEVRPLVEAIIARVHDEATELLDNDGPAPLFGTWAAHPWFQVPALHDADWQDLRDHPPAS